MNTKKKFYKKKVFYQEQLSEKQSKVKLLLFSLCLLIFIDAIGLGLIFPIMPQLFLDKVNGLVTSKAYLSRDMLYGIAFSVYPLLGFFGMPMFGALSDSFGRKKMLLIGLGGMILGYILSIISVFIHNFELFIISRAVCGYCSGTYTIANAAIADVSHGPNSKLANFKWPVFAGISGFTLGPGIAIFISYIRVSNQLTIPFIIAMFLSLINWFLLFIILPETNTQKNIENIKSEVYINLSSVIYVIKTKSIRIISLSYIFFMLAYGLFLQSISIFLAKEFNYTTGEIGSFFVFLGVLFGFTVIYLQPLIYKWINYVKTIKIVFIASSLLFLIQTISGFRSSYSSTVTILISGLFYLLIPFVTLGFRTLASEAVSKKEQGHVMGGLGQIYSTTFFITAIMIGDLMSSSKNLIFALSVIFVLISYFLFTKIPVES